jgi:hypothetical protein
MTKDCDFSETIIFAQNLMHGWNRIFGSTSVLYTFQKGIPDCHITWLIQSPDVLPKEGIDIIFRPDAFSLFTLQQSQFDIAINLDKEQEVCQLQVLAHAS